MEKSLRSISFGNRARFEPSWGEICIPLRCEIKWHNKSMRKCPRKSVITLSRDHYSGFDTKPKGGPKVKTASPVSK